MPAPRQTKVKVYLRTRPTENFANEMIEFGPDAKVNHFLFNFSRIINNLTCTFRLFQVHQYLQ